MSDSKLARSSGVTSAIPDAAGGQEQVVTLPVNLDLKALGRAVITTLQSNSPVDVALQAKVKVGTPFGEIPLDVADSAAFLLR